MKAGWEVKTLGEVCELYQPKTITSKEMTETGAFPVFGANGIIGRYHLYNHENSQLVIGCRGACGTVHVTEPKSWITGNSMVVAPRSSSLSKEFVRYFLLGPVDLGGVITGAAQPQITRTSLSPVTIPLPPLDEQKRIVEVLDAAFEGLSRARAHTETNLQNARELFESGLDAAFENGADDFELLPFGEKGLVRIIDGDRGANYPKKEDFLVEGHCLFLNTKNVRPDGFDFSQCMFIDEQKDKALRKGKLVKRDVLLTTRGTIGNIAIFDDSVPYGEIRINSGMLILRPNEDRILAEYLFEVLRSRFVKAQISEKTSGAAQPQLPIGTLVGISLPVPTSLAAQKRIVERLQEIGTQADELQSHYRAKLADLDALRQALLQKAFSGELT